jgi:hypothetical protein
MFNQNRKEMKALELIRNARSKKCRLEYTNGLTFDFIGFCFPNKNVWHWYTVWDDGSVNFDHSYSCVNGKVSKGLRHRIRINTSMNACC